ncbi:MAG: 16S rRNA (cytidine(1402)-2'-O)-methyltransferase [Aquificaceae bacterium]
MTRLYVVSTPIGNLSDITFRAVEVLRSVEFIACEDTRRTAILLNHFGIEDKKLLSYYQPKESVQVPKILKLLEHEAVALVSDAGTPSVSDPGYKLIRSCIERNVPIEVVPGPSAVMTALVGSGLPTDRFMFLGFLPRKSLERYFKELETIKDMTFIAFEAPSRLLKSVQALQAVYGDEFEVCVARELTKIHEEFIRGNARQVREKLEAMGEIKGEAVLLWRR